MRKEAFLYGFSDRFNREKNLNSTNVLFYAEEFLDFLWERSADVEKGIEHYVPQGYIKRFGSTNRIIRYSKDGTARYSARKYRDMAFFEYKKYGNKLENFLGEFESIFIDFLDKHDLNGASVPTLENIKNLLSHNYNRFILSLFICVQYYRTPKAIEAAERSMPTKSNYERIREGVLDAFFVVFSRTWLFVYDRDYSLWLPPAPVFVYARKIKEIPNWQVLFLGKDPEYFYSNLSDITSPCYFPINKHLLLYISDPFAADKPWELDTSPEIKIFYDSSLREVLENPIMNMRWITTSEKDPTSQIYYSVEEEIMKDGHRTKAKCTVGINLSSIIFAEYCFAASYLSDFVYVCAEDYDNNVTFIFDKRFSVIEGVKDILKNLNDYSSNQVLAQLEKKNLRWKV